MDVPEAEKAVQSITYDVTGNNARFNQNTIDQSVNIMQLSSDAAKILANLGQEIDQCIDDPSQRSETLKAVDCIAKQFNSGPPDRIVVDGLVKLLPHAGNIASVASLLQAYPGG